MATGYGSYGICDSCGADNEYCKIIVTLPLSGGEDHRYYCPKCSLEVSIPISAENRFILDLEEEQTDQFGNSSWFRSQLAVAVKAYGMPDRLYALSKIPQLELHCPKDRVLLELCDDCPTAQKLICSTCGKRTVTVDVINWISGSVVTLW